MLDHLGIQCADMQAAAAFYDTVLATIGATRIMDFGEAMGYGKDGKPDFWIGRLTTGEPNREVHVAFEAPDRAAVIRLVVGATSATDGLGLLLGVASALVASRLLTGLLCETSP